jgi:hypothetical protein
MPRGASAKPAKRIPSTTWPMATPREPKAIRLSPAASAGRPDLEQMDENVRRLLRALSGERQMVRILMHGAMGIDDEFDRKLDDFYRRVAGLIARALRLGMDMGLVRTLDPDVAAWCVLGSVKEATDHVLLAEEPGDRAGDERLDALGRELMAFNLNGLFRTA